MRGRSTFSYDCGWGGVIQAEGTVIAEALRPGQTSAEEPVVAGVSTGGSSGVMGNTGWNCPACPGTTVTIRVSYFTTGGPGKEHRTNKPPPTEEFRKGQKEMPCVLPPPRSLFVGIHLDWAMCAPPGRNLSQNDWPETARNWPHHHKIRDFEPRDWQSSPPGFPYPAALHLGSPSQECLFLCQHMCLLRQFVSEC